MQEMNPLISIGLAHPKELPLHLLDRILFQIGQDEEELVRHRRQGTGLIRTVPAARAGVPINGAVPHVRLECLLKMGQQGLKLLLR